MIAAGELPFEFALNAFRLVEGFPAGLFPQRTGLPWTALEAGLKRAEEKGLVARDLQRIRPTDRGRRFLDDLQQIFLP